MQHWLVRSRPELAREPAPAVKPEASSLNEFRGLAESGTFPALLCWESVCDAALAEATTTTS